MDSRTTTRNPKVPKLHIRDVNRESVTTLLEPRANWLARQSTQRRVGCCGSVIFNRIAANGAPGRTSSCSCSFEPRIAIDTEWPVSRILALSDRATGTHVLQTMRSARRNNGAESILQTLPVPGLLSDLEILRGRLSIFHTRIIHPKPHSISHEAEEGTTPIGSPPGMSLI
jgi:hypothetical protein